MGHLEPLQPPSVIGEQAKGPEVTASASVADAPLLALWVFGVALLSGVAIGAAVVLPVGVVLPLAIGLTATCYWLASSYHGRRIAAGVIEVDEQRILPQRRFLPALKAELARSRRYGREFAVVIAGLDEQQRRYDFHSSEDVLAAAASAAQLLLTTRAGIDQVFDLGEQRFALILPESGPQAVEGMVRRMRRAARSAARGSLFPFKFGATFYPSRATTAAALVQRANLAFRIAGNGALRLRLDGAAAPAEPSPEVLRSRPAGRRKRRPAEVIATQTADTSSDQAASA